MYRMVTLAVLQAGVDPDDADAVAQLLPQFIFDTPVNAGMGHHRLTDRDVSTEIRGTAVLSRGDPGVGQPRRAGILLDGQRNLALGGRMVVEGRDIGTVVTHDPTLKIYLDHRCPTARRRHQQNAGIRARAESGSGGSSLSGVLSGSVPVGRYFVGQYLVGGVLSGSVSGPAPRGVLPDSDDATWLIGRRHDANRRYDAERRYDANRRYDAKFSSTDRQPVRRKPPTPQPIRRCGGADLQTDAEDSATPRRCRQPPMPSIMIPQL